MYLDPSWAQENGNYSCSFVCFVTFVGEFLDIGRGKLGQALFHMLAFISPLNLLANFALTQASLVFFCFYSPSSDTRPNVFNGFLTFRPRKSSSRLPTLTSSLSPDLRSSSGA